MPAAVWPHLLALLVVVPALVDRWLFAPFGADAGARLGSYARIIAWQWLTSGTILLCLAPATVWYAPPDAAALLGLPPAWVAYAAAAGFVAGVALPALRRPRARKKRTSGFWPQGRAERAAWALVALTSGVCEEIMFRGFLLSYGHVFPWHWSWPVTIGASCAAFALGHLYQGLGSALRAAAAAALVCGLFLASGSLLVPAAAHAAGDLAGLLSSLRRPRSG